MSDLVQREWSSTDLTKLADELGVVLLEEWGGPRSPLALKYINETIIPDLVSCFCNNSDLLANVTFGEIIQWKMKNQFANPSAVVADLTKDLLSPAQKIIHRPQITDPKEPWRRIFRLWICDESLPNISERLGYPLDYLDLLILRFKKLKAFTMNHRASLLECLQNPELREIGKEQLSFLYQFHSSMTAEPLFKERLTLEQVIIDLGLPLQVSDLITLLEIIHTHEGHLDDDDIISSLGEVSGILGPVLGPSSGHRVNLFSCVIDGLTSMHYIQKNKAGKLTLSEKSAKTIANFLLPKLGEQLKKALAINDLESAKGILLRQNEEVLIKLIDWTLKELKQEHTLNLHKSIFKQISRRVDIYLIKGFADIPNAQELLLNCLGDNDSLIRANACHALGRLKSKNAVFSLIQLLKDPVANVKEMAAQALGEIGSSSAIRELNRVVEDYGESVNVRERARIAIRRIESETDRESR